MEIIAVEIASRGELAPVADLDHARVGPLDQSVLLQGLQGSIDVDRGQAGGVGKLLLSQMESLGEIGPGGRGADDTLNRTS